MSGKGKYEDIIGMEHHVSTKRPRMSMADRAAQFSPFAALTGYDAAIRETGRLTDRRIELGEDELEILNRKLRALAAGLVNRDGGRNSAFCGEVCDGAPDASGAEGRTLNCAEGRTSNCAEGCEPGCEESCEADCADDRAQVAAHCGQQVTITYFKPDARKEGGSYETITGAVKKIDGMTERIIMEDGRAVPFADLFDIEGKGILG